MTQAAKAQEPSMEEILASIRRIIADDDAVKSPPAPPEPPRAPPVAAAPLRSVAAAPATPAPESVPLAAAAAEPSINEIVLDEMLAELNATTAPAADAEDRAAKARLASPSAPGFRTVEGPSAPEHFAEPSAAHDGPQMQAPERGQQPLMSAATSAAVDSAFNKLAQTVRVQNARTLEDVIKDMLQPLLKSWLDGHLPGLVEQLVRAEIERISRGRG
jgi:cell pole-organizing protein PopZ